MNSFDSKINRIVEYFVIKNPAQKSNGDKITNYPISFRQFGIVRNKKTKIIQDLKQNKKITVTKVNSVLEIKNLISSFKKAKDVVVIKKDCFSQLDELFRIARNGLAHGNFVIERNKLICWSNNKKGDINGYVNLHISVYLEIINLVFSN